MSNSSINSAPGSDGPKAEDASSRRVTRARIAGGLVGAGLLAGAVFAATSTNTIAGAATIASSSAASTTAAGAEDIVVSSAAPTPGSSGSSGTSGTEDSTTGSADPGTDDPNGRDRGPMPGGMHALGQSGTVTAVGTASVTIKTATATTTYSVTADSDIHKNGEAKLSALKVGDAVIFSTSGNNVIAKLLAGTEGMRMPGGMRTLDKSGTVTAVGTASVTIKTATATTTYSVTADSDIDKNGEAKLSALKVGDAVRFTTTGTNVIDKLHAGTESLNMPGSGRGGPGGRHGGGAGYAAPNTGTITALGASSITIKTSTATTIYTVNAGSDMDLATGEGTLAKLKVGDSVLFTVTGTNVIDHLRVK